MCCAAKLDNKFPRYPQKSVGNHSRDAGHTVCTSPPAHWAGPWFHTRELCLLETHVGPGRETNCKRIVSRDSLSSILLSVPIAALKSPATMRDRSRPIVKASLFNFSSKTHSPDYIWPSSRRWPLDMLFELFHDAVRYNYLLLRNDVFWN